jgi:hypothetical protein
MSLDGRIARDSLSCEDREVSVHHAVVSPIGTSAVRHLALTPDGLTTEIEGCRRAQLHALRVAPLATRSGGALRAYDTDRGVLICAVGDRVRMMIDHAGESITLDYDEADELARSVTEACSGNLCHAVAALLRGELPLHCAGVEIGGRQVAVMATSGAGKTTLLWHLLDHGARLVCDDVLVLTRGGQGSGDGVRGPLCGTPTVGMPAKLPEDAIRERGLDWGAARRVLPDEDDWWVPVPDELQAREPLPVSALFVLQPYTDPQPPAAGGAFLLRGGEAIRVLCDNTQGLWAVQSLVDGRRLMGMYDDLLRQAPLFALRYRRQREIIPELARAVRELSSAEPSPITRGPVEDAGKKVAASS